MKGRWIKSVTGLFALSLMALVLSCSDNKRSLDPVRSVYYWSTTFNLDSVKRAFLDKHRIDRIYVRYFDVVPATDFPVPNATIRIDSVPGNLTWEIVPVVFVLPDALDCDLDLLGQRILTRVCQMSETHGMGPVKELQIDCDWTVSTRQRFFDFMQSLRQRTEAEGITLSSTIRLHQLASAPPPANKGVLMVYNTGDMRDISKEKPILDPEDVMPYLKYLKDYPLQLATAYPVYRWELLFRNGQFVDILHYPDEIPVLPSDTVVERQPTYDDIMTSRKAIESRRPQCGDEIILFDLSKYNIERYENQCFEDFYN